MTSLVIVLVIPTSVSGSDETGALTFLFPTQGLANESAVAADIAVATGTEPRYILGSDHDYQPSVHEGSGVVEVTLASAQGDPINLTYRGQKVRELSGERYYRIDPTSIEPGVEFWSGGAYAVVFLEDTGAGSHDDLSESAESMARRLGLPDAEPDVWEPTPLNGTMTVLSGTWSNQPYREFRHVFEIDCETCSLLERRAEWHGNNFNRIHLLHQGDHPIALLVDPWIDPESTDAISLEEAEAAVRARLDTMNATVHEVHHGWASLHAEKMTVEYFVSVTWNETASQANRTSTFVVDALTGQVVDRWDKTPGGGATSAQRGDGSSSNPDPSLTEEDGSRDEWREEASAPGTTAIVLLLLLASMASPRRRR